MSCKFWEHLFTRTSQECCFCRRLWALYEFSTSGMQINVDNLWKKMKEEYPHEKEQVYEINKQSKEWKTLSFKKTTKMKNIWTSVTTKNSYEATSISVRSTYCHFQVEQMWCDWNWEWEYVKKLVATTNETTPIATPNNPSAKLISTKNWKHSSHQSTKFERANIGSSCPKVCKIHRRTPVPKSLF